MPRLSMYPNENSINLQQGFVPLRESKLNGFERQQNRQWYVHQFLRCKKHSATLENEQAPSMWDDSKMARKAHNLQEQLFTKVDSFLERGGKLRDAQEVLASLIDEKEFKRIARDWYHLTDPLD